MFTFVQVAAVVQTGLVHFVSGVVHAFGGFSSLRGKPENRLPQKHHRKQQGISVLASRRGEQLKADEPAETKKAVNTIIQCSLWNGGICGLSLVFYWTFILPVFEYVSKLAGLSDDSHALLWDYTQTIVSYAFHSLWVIPMMLLGKLVNSIWFQDLADVAWTMTKQDRRGTSQPAVAPFGVLMADILFTLLAEAFFLLQGELVLQLQGLVTVTSFAFIITSLSCLHTSLLYAMYAFEYKWYCEGQGVKARMAMVESLWLYYFGFGMPLTLLTSYPESYYVRCILFSLGFPWLILAAFHSNEKALSGRVFRVKFFAPSYWLANKAFTSVAAIARIFTNR